MDQYNTPQSILCRKGRGMPVVVGKTCYNCVFGLTNVISKSGDQVSGVVGGKFW